MILFISVIFIASSFQAMMAVSQTATAKAIESLILTQLSEGVVGIAGAQQLINGAQTTPPVTSRN